jgi:hypothetical protein
MLYPTVGQVTLFYTFVVIFLYTGIYVFYIFLYVDIYF